MGSRRHVRPSNRGLIERHSTAYRVQFETTLFRSFDGGHTWQDINAGITTLNMGGGAPVIIDPGNGQTLYLDDLTYSVRQ